MPDRAVTCLDCGKKRAFGKRVQVFLGLSVISYACSACGATWIHDPTDTYPEEYQDEVRRMNREQAHA